MVDLHRLAVFSDTSACSTVAHMSYSHVALTERLKHLMCKYIVDQTNILVGMQYTVIIYGNTTSLLTSVLQGIETVINRRSNICGIRRINSEYTAFQVLYQAGVCGIHC